MVEHGESNSECPQVYLPTRLGPVVAFHEENSVVPETLNTLFVES